MTTNRLSAPALSSALSTPTAASTARRASLASFGLACIALAGCVLEGPPPGPGPGSGSGDDPPPSAGCDEPSREIAGGDVEGSWCGRVTLLSPVTVPEGRALSIEAGTIVDVAEGGAIVVDGALDLAGTAEAPIRISSDGFWSGVLVRGALRGGFAAISGFNGELSLAAGGEIALTDVSLDMLVPVDGPDCTSINGGSLVLDHVRFTGCHCPIHINRADVVNVTNSVFDGAANPVMIANAQATFSGNVFEGASTLMLDIGGGVSASVGGNYWEGGAPDIGTNNPAQFSGVDDYATAPFAGAGPRF